MRVELLAKSIFYLLTGIDQFSVHFLIFGVSPLPRSCDPRHRRGRRADLDSHGRTATLHRLLENFSTWLQLADQQQGQMSISKGLPHHFRHLKQDLECHLSAPLVEASLVSPLLLLALLALFSFLLAFAFSFRFPLRVP